MWNEAQQILNQAVARLLYSVANVLPAVLALALVVLLAAVLAWIIRGLLRRFLRKLNFDQYLARLGLSAIAEWSPSRSPTLLLTSVIFWTIILLGGVIGFNALSAPLASRLALGLLVLLRQILVAALILAIGTVIARFLARGALITAANLQIQSARLLSLGVKWLILVLAGAMALEHLGVGGGMVRLAFGILFGGIVLALALAVGLGSKEMISRSWERQATKTEEQAEEHFHHL